MRIFINDFELNSAANRVYVNEDIEGLELPNIRTSKGQRAGSHGSYIGKQLFAGRSITLQGRIFSDNVPQALEKRRLIQEALPLYPEQVVLRIVDEDGTAYVIYCQVIDFKMPIGRFRGKSNFKLDLEATDPTIYDDTAGGMLMATITKAVSGGMLFSPTTPVFGSSFMFSAGQPETTVTNTSKVPAMPIIVIEGKTTNPVLINRLTGEKIQLNGYAVSADSVTQFDMKNRAVRLGSAADLVDGRLPDGVGANMFGYVPAGSSWWALELGDNPIGFESNSGTDVTQARLYWRPGYWGR